MRAEVDVRPVRERPARPGRARLRAVPWKAVAAWTTGLLAALVLFVGVVFAGSPGRIAAGVEIAGVKVSGLPPAAAVRRLEERAAEMASVPVVFTAAGEEVALRPRELDARVDWPLYVGEAQDKGDWPMPFRGLKRVALRLFGAEVEPTADVYEPRLAHELARLARSVDEPGRDAAIVLRGLEPALVADRDGRTLNRRESGDRIVHALAQFDREPVALPVTVGPPSVTSEELEPVLAEVRTALSGPVRFGWRDAHWLVQPEQLSDLLRLPADGRRELAVGGPGAERYFGVLSRAVDRRPRAAIFAIEPDGESVRIVPSQTGRELDAEASGRALLAGALAPDRREAELVVSTVEPRLTTEVARGMKVTSVLAAYATAYAGSYDRIRNLQLAVGAIDGTTLGPGATFSFNDVVGPRTAKRGYRKAPTIIDGEYEDTFGGGVSQVATTVFNAAWEAGLPIPERTAHSLYIARYPDGRDATVSYPDIDLRFSNDTDGWVVVRAQAGDTGITITLLGAPLDRRVVSESGPLREIGPPEVERVPDPTMLEGTEVIEDEGEPARSITVTRVVYEGDEVLYDERWTTNYLSEPTILRVGTIPVQEEPPPPPAPPPTAPVPPPAPPGGTTTGTTTTAPTGTGTGR